MKERPKIISSNDSSELYSSCLMSNFQSKYGGVTNKHVNISKIITFLFGESQRLELIWHSLYDFCINSLIE